jgi:hypothetical protein
MVATAVKIAAALQRKQAPLDLFGPVPVPRLWPGETVVCIGSGPSLTQEDVDACRGRRVIAIKNAVEMAPWADVLYGSGSDACGRTWWSREGPRLVFGGLRYALDHEARHWASILAMDTTNGLALDPSRLALGGHSGYQAINLAVHLGAARVVLLGYDMQATGGKEHFFGPHPHGVPPPFAHFVQCFPAIVDPLQQAGVEVVNASRVTALTIFPRMSLAEALA